MDFSSDFCNCWTGAAAMVQSQVIQKVSTGSEIFDMFSRAFKFCLTYAYLCKEQTCAALWFTQFSIVYSVQFALSQATCCIRVLGVKPSLGCEMCRSLTIFRWRVLDFYSPGDSPEYGSPFHQTKAQTCWQGIKGMSLDAIADLLSMEPSEVARILARQETNTED